MHYSLLVVVDWEEEEGGLNTFEALGIINKLMDTYVYVGKGRKNLLYAVMTSCLFRMFRKERERGSCSKKYADWWKKGPRIHDETDNPWKDF